MSFDSDVKNIRKVYGILTGKSDNDVIITYKGTNYGVTKPWHIKIDNREENHESYDGAAVMLLAKLKQELANKVVSTEREAEGLRKALSNLEN